MGKYIIKKRANGTDFKPPPICSWFVTSGYQNPAAHKDKDKDKNMYSIHSIVIT